MQLALLACSVFAAGLPMTGFVSLIWWLDRYEREPVWLVATSFLWGAVGAIGVAMLLTILGSVTLAAVLGGPAPALDAVLLAPLFEEPSKALILVPIAASRHFDNMTDGFVYGAAAGLGFGMTENLLYYASASGDLELWIGTVLIRTFYSAVMHATATAAVGAGLGWARFRSRAAMLVLGSVGLSIAMGIHAGWNGLLTVAQTFDLAAAWYLDLLLLPVVVLCTFVVFELCLLEEKWILRHELKHDVEAGLIPSHHPAIVASWRKRWRRDWLPEGVPRDHYIAQVVTLAMRRHQLRLQGERAPKWLRDDVAAVQGEIRRLLAPLPPYSR